MDRLLLYSILKGKSGAEVSASGNPVTLPNTVDGGRMKDMKLYGWSKQESTTGKNLFDFSRLESDGVNVIDYEKQTITVPAKTNNTGYNQTLRDLCPDITPGTYVFSMNRSNPESGAGSYFLEATLDFPINTPIELTDELLDNHIAWYNNPNSDVENVISEIQIEAGDAATAYEPYTGGQPSPSPDYPQQIVSAGSDGKIGIEVRGKNLVDIYGYSASDIPSPEAKRVLFNTYGTTLSTTEKTDKLIVNQKIIDGASFNNYTSGYFCIGINRKLEDEKDYIITFNIDVIQNPFSASAVFVFLNGIEAYKAKIIGNKVTVKAKNIEYRERQYVEVRTCGMSMEISNFMITEKDENTIYEPYHEPQSLSISTPTGLPAIPVDTDGNYTDASGQQWIADYVDLKRGKYVQNVYKLSLKNLKNNWHTWGVNKYTTNTGFYAYVNEYFRAGNKRALSTICQYEENSWGGRKIGCYMDAANNYIMLSVRTDDLEDSSTDAKARESFEKIIEQTDAYVICAMSDTIERDLATAEIQAYKALTTYGGTMVIENDSGCYMTASVGSADALRAKKLALILGE